MCVVPLSTEWCAPLVPTVTPTLRLLRLTLNPGGDRDAASRPQVCHHLPSVAVLTANVSLSGEAGGSKPNVT